MDGREVYEIWAPKNAKWTEWVRPVPFVAIDKYHRKPNIELIEREISAVKEYSKDTAIFIDLPSEESIEYGIVLAKKGYRPIAIYNGTDEENNSIKTTETHIIESALIAGAIKLKSINIDKNASPAFLLDSTRTMRHRINNCIFDNSWDLYGQDIPSYNYFKNNGIEKIVIIGEKVQSDLRKIFFKFQNAGIKFFITDGYNKLEKVKLKKSIKEMFEKEEI